MTMTIETYRRKVKTCQQNLASLQAEKGRFSLKAVAAFKRKQSALAAAHRSTNVSTINMKEREAVRHESDQSKALVDMAKVDRKIADEQKKLSAAQSKLDQAVAREQKKQDVSKKKNDADLKKQQVEQKRAPVR
ncbi:hypothetical protein PMI30_05053 [Pseudomonas sp. GM50]|jgi:hypothetical protein|uniref:hypothetical protein n=1 Tax=Pseudomonas sp. GM50 TaxID=1144332 RepID=UPI000270713B|nr:hypothetical protein [Pseudomonas sp. GM50]EJM61915.1 hypothetical protein PMI30_05053 [Pseudomonas sp. GM50]